MKLFFLLTLTLLFSGCNAPINNQVRTDKGNQTLESEPLLFSQTQVSVDFRWLKGPYGQLKQENHLVVFLYQEEEPYSLPETQSLNFYATMPSMGHPMEDAGFFEEIEPGVYINKSIRYNMPGDWQNELWIMDQDFNILDKVQWLVFF